MCWAAISRAVDGADRGSSNESITLRHGMKNEDIEPNKTILQHLQQSDAVAAVAVVKVPWPGCGNNERTHHSSILLLVPAPPPPPARLRGYTLYLYPTHTQLLGSYPFARKLLSVIVLTPVPSIRRLINSIDQLWTMD